MLIMVFFVVYVWFNVVIIIVLFVVVMFDSIVFKLLKEEFVDLGMVDLFRIFDRVLLGWDFERVELSIVVRLLMVVLVDEIFWYM